MKVKDLLSKLQDANPESTVWLYQHETPCDFSGFSIDDNLDISIYAEPGDT